MTEFYIKQGELGPALEAVLMDGDEVADLNGATGVFGFVDQEGNAFGGPVVILNAAEGRVQYAWQAGQTDVPGVYAGTFTFTMEDGSTLTLPGEGAVWQFEILAAGMADDGATGPRTLVSDLIEPVRAFLGDFGEGSKRRYSDKAVGMVVRTVIRTNGLPGFGLDGTRLRIVPVITQPATFGLLVYKACIAFVMPQQSAYSFRTKQLGESFGHQRDFVWDLHNAIFDLENATLWATWQSFAGWAQSLTGIDLWAHLTEMQTSAPIASVTIGRQGLVMTLKS